MRRRVALIVTLVIVISLIAVGLFAMFTPSTRASAWVGPSRIVSSKTAPLDWCPGNASICQDSSRMTTLAGGTAVTMVCWIDARIPTGYKYGRWFYVTSGSNQGFVKAELVTNQNPSSPWCLDKGNAQRRGVAASLWATGLSEFHQVYPTTTDKANALSVYHFNSWGKYGDWSGDCVMFTGLAWWSVGQKIHSGSTAAVIAGTYSLKSGTPPRGAAVFWNWTSGGINWGHVAISLGNGMVVTTQGMDNDRLQTTNSWITTLNKGMSYRGWTPTP